MDNSPIAHVYRINMDQRIYVLHENSPSAQTFELIQRNCIEQVYHSFQKAPWCMSVLSNDLAS